MPRSKWLFAALVSMGWCVSLPVSLPAAGQQQGQPQPNVLPKSNPSFQTVASPEGAAWVEQLVNELGDDRWKVRQKAQDTLVQLGPDVLPRLVTAAQTTQDEEVRSRAEAAISRIEDARATGTSLITLHVRGGSPKDVFAEISRQAGADLRPSPATLWDAKPWPAVDLDFDRKPFWLVMREVCDLFGVSPKSNGNERDVEIVERVSSNNSKPWGTSPTVVNGPFMVSATYINRSHYADLNQPNNVRRNASVQLLVYAEPKLRVLQGTYNARIDEALDEAGNSLVPPGVSHDGLQPNSNWVMNLNCSLTPTEQTGNRIARLKGAGRFLVQTRSETAEVVDVLNARNVSRTVGGKRFTLKEVRKNGESSYQATITLYRAGWNLAEWNYMYPYSNFRMVDAAGRSLARVTASGQGGGQDQTDVTIQFQRSSLAGGEASGEPVKLVWEVATETREVVVPFEFKDLPLP
jgi:hypothetical protein